MFHLIAPPLLKSIKGWRHCALDPVFVCSISRDENPLYCSPKAPVLRAPFLWIPFFLGGGFFICMPDLYSQHCVHVFIFFFKYSCQCVSERISDLLTYSSFALSFPFVLYMSLRLSSYWKILNIFNSQCPAVNNPLVVLSLLVFGEILRKTVELQHPLCFFSTCCCRRHHLRHGCTHTKVLSYSPGF